VARWIGAFADGTRIWRPSHPDEVGIVAVVGGAAFPLLGAAYGHGAAPLGVIPRWAEPVLGEPNPRAAARSAFGAKATRPVVSALASSLVQEPRPDSADTNRAGPGEGPSDRLVIGLLPLALALMGAPVLEPDRLARVLVQTEVLRGPDDWPTGEQIAACRQIVANLGPVRTERILCDVLTRVDGPRLLADLVGLYTRVRHRLTGPVASRLEDLRNQCRDLLPVDPNPHRGLRTPSQGTSVKTTRRRTPGTNSRDRSTGVFRVPDRMPLPRADPARREPDARDQALRPPLIHAVDPASTEALRFPRSLADLDGDIVGERLRLTVPRTTGQLAVWGNGLGNCLGTFGEAVAAGRSWLLGVELEGRIAYCMELTPNGSIRQFLGDRNRRVPIADAAAVCTHLVSAGVVDPDNRDNRAWLR
jgi:hypothetical protein